MIEERQGARAPKNWASQISLVTLLAVVFGAGALYTKLDALAEQIKDVVPRIQALEMWRAAVTAVREATGAHRPALPALRR